MSDEGIATGRTIYSPESVSDLDSNSSAILQDTVLHQAVARRIGISPVEAVIKACRDFPAL
jgi:hypothetical protein